MHNLDLNYDDFLEHCFFHELSLNEETVQKFCSDVLNDLY
jgi:hypothetical protein